MDQNLEESAKTVAMAFIDAFNAQDHARLASTLNYPRVRLANGRFAQIEDAQTFAQPEQRW